ncbi:hypothetical protein [Limnovirga soli]|uniref:Uncharacterized protein n=1 Tax=Limnovirga soli TaxID=2656915 RepID=A0A8J8JWF5_9BACT|nr:hypothetical protein [Limnovirga soli]NNV55251.1 hypothetical protein [Limnovirga soli]
MFKLLLKTFYYQKINYEVNYPKEKLVERIDSLFSDKSGLFQSPNLIGEFINFPNSFSLVPKRSLAVIRNFERSAAYLKGTIVETVNGKTKIEILLRPNSIFGMFFLFFVPFSMYNVCIYFSTAGTPNNLYVGLFILIVALPLQFVLARVMANGLRKNFEKYFSAHRKEGE